MEPSGIVKISALGVEEQRVNGQQARILAGLEPGDTIVLYPSKQIGDGTRVQLRDEAR